MSEGLRVLLRIEIRPGRQREFEQLWLAHAAFIRRLPENCGQALLADRAADNVYVVLSDWVDEPAFRAFERSDEQQRYLQRLWPMRVGGSMTLLRSMADLPPVPAAGSG